MLLVSVDVQRFEPTKQFTHYMKTTKEVVSGFELYVLSSSQHLEQPAMDLAGTWEAFTAKSLDSTGFDSSGSSGSSSLVAECVEATEEDIFEANRLLQVLPGSCAISITPLPDAAAQPSIAAAAAAGARPGPKPQLQAAGASQPATASSKAGQRVDEGAVAAAAGAVASLLVAWAEADKLDAATALCTAVSELLGGEQRG